MMEQYRAAKAENPDAIMFFRLGDFYEMFFDDAKLVSRELGLTLTSRSKDENRVPMCGVPYHAADTYINKLIAKGYKIAIAEQIGDPKAKGLTKREVTKVVTPGTVLSASALDENANNYIVLLYEADEKIILAGADISTGECFYAVYDDENRLAMLLDELYRLMPPEILLLGALSFQDSLKEFAALRMNRTSFTVIAKIAGDASARLFSHFAADNHPKDKAAKIAVAALLDYLHQTVRADLSQLSKLVYVDATKNLVIDTYTLKNLEITRNLRDGGKKDTLFDVLDFTVTAMGCRLLRKWLEHPLLNTAEIEERLDAVEEFCKNFSLLDEIRAAEKNIYDFERLLTRLEVGSATARDMTALKISLKCLPKIKSLLAAAKTKMLNRAAKNLATHADTAELIEKAILDEPANSLQNGGIIKEGYDRELDEYRRIAADSKKMLQEIEDREKEATGIKFLKIGYNKVFGYYIEVRHSGKDRVPSRYVRKQTLVGAERYVTDELKEFETKILGAQEKIAAIEYNIFSEIREAIKKKIGAIQRTAQEIAAVDATASLAFAARTHNYVRPKIKDDGRIKIRDGRHPLVERILTNDIFVPNDTDLNHDDAETIIITGPNMAGKSTYMRQVALIALMAQTGSFVPAKEATISPVDRIFTRIGASDDLVSGQSTFMVEMNEVAQILKYATKNSLVVLDEIGRGTSTFDGMSIARAVIEHIVKKIRAKTLFATHYHELTDLEGERIKNFCVAVKERGNDIVFLRRIIKGSADKSYGIHVAKLAGLPKSVTKRAEEILAALEGGKKDELRADAKPHGDENEIGSLFTNKLAEKITALDVMSMTPLEALNALYKLQEEAKSAKGEG